MVNAQTEYSHQNVGANSRVIEHAIPIQIADIEQVLTAARPRLSRQAQRRGIAPDAIDDVVQETLVEAWRHLNALRIPESFNAWLDGICRNMCLRWFETYQRDIQHQRHLQTSWQDEDAGELEIADMFALDPIEELNRQDLAILLDRALRYLPSEARQLVEMCYLTELPAQLTLLVQHRTLSILAIYQH